MEGNREQEQVQAGPRQAADGRAVCCDGRLSRSTDTGKPRLGRFPQEDVMPYGNYWIAECLLRALSDDWSVLALNSKA